VDDEGPFRAVAFELSSLGYALSRGFKAAMEPFELEPREFGLLRNVASKEGQSQQAIADRLQIPASRMVAIVDELEGRGLVERRPHAADRRIRELYLTEAGLALVREASEHAAEYERQITASLSDQERTQLLELLARIEAGLGMRPGGAHSALADGAKAELGDVQDTASALA